MGKRKRKIDTQGEGVVRVRERKKRIDTQGEGGARVRERKKRIDTQGEEVAWVGKRKRKIDTQGEGVARVRERKKRIDTQGEGVARVRERKKRIHTQGEGVARVGKRKRKIDTQGEGVARVRERKKRIDTQGEGAARVRERKKRIHTQGEEVTRVGEKNECLYPMKANLAIYENRKTRERRNNMFVNYEKIKSRVRHIEDELKQLEKTEIEWPQGELICAKNGKNCKWYLKRNNRTVYLPKKERELAQKLARKKYCLLRTRELKSELAACRAYMKKAEKAVNFVEKKIENTEYEKLLGGWFCSVNKELEEWKKESYEKNEAHLENLNIKGTGGKYLRSKSEAMIDKILNNVGVPFRYEEKLVLGDAVFYPDFTIKHPRTGKIYYWEHFGMMDNSEYVNRACQKIKIYCNCGIIPSVNLILTYETKEHPFDMDSAEQIVREYFL